MVSVSFGMYIGMRIMPDSSPILGIYIYILLTHIPR